MADAFTKMKRQIMRRVYYTYAIGILRSPVFVHGTLAVVCLVLLTRFVSFPNVLVNILGVRVGEVPRYLFGAMYNTEVWTLVLAAFIVLNFVWMYSRLRQMPRTTDVGGMAYGQ